jgi:hypothetical protein
MNCIMGFSDVKIPKDDGLIGRLAFHDCVGGCDGCLNLDQTDNNGLAPIVTALEAVYQSNNLSSIISRCIKEQCLKS